MSRKCLLEISVETLETALAAERGGADRVELCGNLSAGGVTPSAELVRAVQAQVRIPIFVMIRPRGGDFVYSTAEFAEMKRAISEAKDCRLDGIVAGILRKDRHVDIERTRELVALARPLPVTYHRAFDESADLYQALEDVILAGAGRILTSGGAATAMEGAAAVNELVHRAGERIIILAGSGINPCNIVEIAKRTRASEFHSGLSTAIAHAGRDSGQFQKQVQKLAARLADMS